MNRTRAEKRFFDYKKAKRKEDIAKHIYGTDWYDNFNQYSKNKVHCSRAMCKQQRKTNQKQFKSQGKRWSNRGYATWGGSLSRQSKNWSHSDLVKVMRLEEQLYG